MDDLGERTEAPTPKALSDARNKGQVPKSQDLSGAVLMLGGVVALIALAPMIGEMFQRMLRTMLSGEISVDQLSISSIQSSSILSMYEVMRVMLPVLLIVMVIAYASQFIQVGFLISSDPIKPKWSKLSPLGGVKRIYGKKGIAKAVINTLKLTLLILVSILVIRAQLDTIATLPMLTAVMAMSAILKMAMFIAIILIIILLMLSVIDYIFQRWQHQQEHKMTKQQVKDERRNMEGDPQLKGKRMQMAREIVMQQISQQVPQADVIVTNPTHFSVAIKYDSDGMGAPKVIAKGADLIALRIRQIARTNKVPIVERPPLARALYWGIKVGHEISAEHYEAVAELLAYVYRLEGKADQVHSAAQSTMENPQPQPA
ncbi:MAG: flagellar biosynthesis protein FlhB [Phycisphaerales bacterium]